MSAIPAGFRGQARRLTVADIEEAASTLGLAPREIWSVATVESRGNGFIPGDGRPELLFEAHQFHKLTGGQWDASHPNISSPTWDTSLYGTAGAYQYERLAAAMSLNPDAALKAATWGMFQILGSNYASVGFPDVDSFVAAMCDSEGHQLAAFAAYCRANHLVTSLANHDWTAFKIGYNGPGQDDYAAKLKAAYATVTYPPPGMPPGRMPSPAPDPPPAPPPTPPAPTGPDPVATALAVLTSAIDHMATDVGIAVARIGAPNPSPQTIVPKLSDLTARVTSMSDSLEQALAQGQSAGSF